jgi:hypothetical protein
MKRIIIFVTFIILATISALGQTSTTESAENSQEKGQVKKLAAEFANSITGKGDTVTLERILSADYADLGLFGPITPRGLLFRGYKEGGLQIVTFKFNDDPSLRIYDNTAVMVVGARLKWKNVNSEDLAYLCTLIAVKRKELWQIVGTHCNEFKSQIASPPKAKN